MAGAAACTVCESRPHLASNCNVCITSLIKSAQQVAVFFAVACHWLASASQQTLTLIVRPSRHYLCAKAMMHVIACSVSQCWPSIHGYAHSQQLWCVLLYLQDRCSTSRRPHHHHTAACQHHWADTAEKQQAEARWQAGAPSNTHIPGVMM
jgi:hypothetical protein